MQVDEINFCSSQRVCLEGNDQEENLSVGST